MVVDLRSDTVTKPTDEMRKAMYTAEVGDDVFGDDLTINKLEELAAETLGKQSAMFVPSGTMGNLLAIMTHTAPGQEIIIGKLAHIYRFEVAGYARLCGLGAKIVEETGGILSPDDIEENILKGSNIHQRSTGLICLENTHNFAGGIVSDADMMKQARSVSKKYNVPIHLDGARLYNAATYLNTDIKNLTCAVDSVMLCLSKGLAAPVGSVLAGSKDFIRRARHNRKMIGGGMRQAGILAAAGIIALTKMTDRLVQDHENARMLAEGVEKLDGFDVDLENIQTNIVMVDISVKDKDTSNINDILKKDGILISPLSPKRLRLTTNYHVEKKDVEYVLDKISKI